MRTPPKKHPDYLILATSKTQRKAVFERDTGRCCKCGCITALWDAEHVYPLWLVDREDWPACLKYWTLTNLETVCRNCHKPKTAKEAAARAKIKRIVAKKNGTARKKIKIPVRAKSTKKQKFIPTPIKVLW